MFTLDQINAAHENVKSGEGFPRFVHTLIQMGVTKFETFVADGHTKYYSEHGLEATNNALYKTLVVADEDNRAKFNDYLKAHQDGKSDYHTFCEQAAETGVEKWIVDMHAMTCAYYNKNGDEMLEERIPAILN